MDQTSFLRGEIFIRDSGSDLFIFRSERQLTGHPVSEKGSSNRYTIFDWSLSVIVHQYRYCLVYYLLCLEIDVLSKYLAMLSTQAQLICVHMYLIRSNPSFEFQSCECTNGHSCGFYVLNSNIDMTMYSILTLVDLCMREGFFFIKGFSSINLLIHCRHNAMPKICLFLKTFFESITKYLFILIV